MCMHCHEYLKVQLQLLLNELKSKEWTQNCTEVGEKFEANCVVLYDHYATLKVSRFHQMSSLPI